MDEAGMAEEGEVCVFKGGVSFQGDGGLQELQIVFFFVYANRNVNIFALRMKAHILMVGLLIVQYSIFRKWKRKITLKSCG